MEAVIKRKSIKEIYEYSVRHESSKWTDEELEKVLSNCNNKDKIIHICVGYYETLWEIASEQLGYSLDLTYNTIKNLPESIALLAFVHGPGRDASEVIEIVEKTIAAYLMLLALNEHDTRLEVYIPTVMPSEAGNERTKWSGAITALICSKSARYDFLKSVYGRVYYNGKRINVNFRAIANIYKKLTGVDLYSYEGFDNISSVLPN